MFSGTTKYLIDANVIRSLSVETIKSKLAPNRVIATIPDVEYEVLSLSHKLELIRTDTLAADVYLKVKELLVYRSVRNVIDYYNYKGTADVMLLAHAKTAEGVGMLKDKIVIVTNDVKLRLACDELRIIWKSMEDFKGLDTE